MSTPTVSHKMSHQVFTTVNSVVVSVNNPLVERVELVNRDTWRVSVSDSKSSTSASDGGPRWFCFHHFPEIGARYVLRFWGRREENIREHENVGGNVGEDDKNASKLLEEVDVRLDAAHAYPEHCQYWMDTGSSSCPTGSSASTGSSTSSSGKGRKGELSNHGVVASVAKSIYEFDERTKRSSVNEGNSNSGTVGTSQTSQSSSSANMMPNGSPPNQSKPPYDVLEHLPRINPSVLARMIPQTPLEYQSFIGREHLSFLRVAADSATTEKSGETETQKSGKGGPAYSSVFCHWLYCARRFLGGGLEKWDTGPHPKTASLVNYAQLASNSAQGDGVIVPPPEKKPKVAVAQGGDGAEGADINPHYRHSHVDTTTLDNTTTLDLPPLPGGILPCHIFAAEGDFLWIAGLDDEIVFELYLCACFTLPSFLPRPLCAVINPEKRYCLDLLWKDPANGNKTARWDRNKTVRKYAKDLRITVNSDFRGSIQKLCEYHLDPKNSGSTWCDKELKELLVRFHDKNPQWPLKQFVFEFWEGDTLAAVCAGFAVGAGYHDYSMATFIKDQRGFGHIASKTVGHILQRWYTYTLFDRLTHYSGYFYLIQSMMIDLDIIIKIILPPYLSHSGFEIWYWGCKIGYMENYDTYYGGKNFPRAEFATRWLGAADRGCRAEIAPADRLEPMLRSGEGLVKWKE